MMMNESGLYTIKDLLFDRNQDPYQNAIECPGMLPMTYDELRWQVLSVVKTLNARGFHRNDRIAVIMPAGPETAVTIISVMAGFTCIALNPQETEQEYERYFHRLKIKAIIVQSGYETAAPPAATSQNIPVIELIPVGGKAGKFELGPPFVQDAPVAEFAAPTDISHIFFYLGNNVPAKNRARFPETVVLFPAGPDNAIQYHEHGQMPSYRAILSRAGDRTATPGNPARRRNGHLHKRLYPFRF